MDLNEIHAHLQTALHEDCEDAKASAESIRTYALAAIALELRDASGSLPRCVSATGGHRWNMPDDQGLQVCRTCALVRPVETNTKHLPYEVFHFGDLGPRPGSSLLAGLETHGKQEREGNR